MFDLIYLTLAATAVGGAVVFSKRTDSQVNHSSNLLLASKKAALVQPAGGQQRPRSAQSVAQQPILDDDIASGENKEQDIAYSVDYVNSLKSEIVDLQMALQGLHEEANKLRGRLDVDISGNVNEDSNISEQSEVQRLNEGETDQQIEENVRHDSLTAMHRAYQLECQYYRQELLAVNQQMAKKEEAWRNESSKIKNDYEMMVNGIERQLLKVKDEAASRVSEVENAYRVKFDERETTFQSELQAAETNADAEMVQHKIGYEKRIKQQQNQTAEIVAECGRLRRLLGLSRENHNQEISKLKAQWHSEREALAEMWTSRYSDTENKRLSDEDVAAETILKLRMELSDLGSSYKTLVDQNETLKQTIVEHETRENEWVQVKADLVQSSSDETDRRDRHEAVLKSNISEKDNKIEQLVKQLNEATQTKKSQSDELDDVKKRLVAADDLLLKLKKEKEDLVTSNSEMRVQLDEVNAKHKQELERETGALKSAHAFALHELDTKTNRKISKLREGYELKLNKALQDRQQEVESSRATYMDSLDTMKKSQNDRLEGEKKVLHGLLMANTELHHQNEMLRRSNDKAIATAVEGMARQFADDKAQWEKLAMHHRQMSKLRDELTSRTSEVEGLVAVKAENEKKIQDLTNAKDNLERSMAELEQELKGLKHKLTNIEESHKLELASVHRKYEQDLDDLQSNTQGLRSSSATKELVDAQVAEVESKHSREIATLKIEFAKEKNQAIKEATKNLEVQIERLRSQGQKLAEQLENSNKSMSMSMTGNTSMQGGSASASRSARS